MEWSHFGTNILAVHQDSDDGSSHISLYTHSNYIWHLKQYFSFNRRNPVYKIMWQPLQSGYDTSLIVVASKGIAIYHFRHEIECSENFSHLGVIEGSTFRMTTFDDAKIPPPMNSVVLEAEAPINFFCIDSSKRICALVDCHYTIKVYHYKKSEIPYLIGEIPLRHSNPPPYPLYFYRFFWYEGELCFSVRNVGDDYPQKCRLNVDTSEYEVIDGEDKLYNSYIIEEGDARAPRKLDHDDFLLSPTKFQKKQIGDKTYIFYLAPCHKLFLNRKLISSEVTTFFVNDKYIYATVTTDKLFCVRSDEAHLELLLSHGLNEKFFFARTVEHGAQIMTVYNNSPEVVLSIPRGNLETINCQIIALDMVFALMQDHEWKEAIRLIRLYRLDWNVMIDLDPDAFFKHLEEIVYAFEKPSILKSMCLDITDESVLSNKYTKWKIGDYVTVENKRVKVCEAILGVLEENGFRVNLKPIVYICMHHFSLRRAFHYMQNMLEMFEDNPKYALIGQETVSLLQTKYSDDELFNEALAIYDIDLVEYLTDFSSKDPGAYKPFLADLRKLSEIERRYEINMYLKNFKLAIKYLIRIPDRDIDSIKSLIMKHQISDVAYYSCPKGSPYLEEVTKLYASHLSMKGLHNDAAIVLLRSDLYELSLQKYILALNTKQVMKLLKIVEYDKENQCQMLVDFASKLIDHNRAKEAGEIYECIGEVQTAVTVYVEADLYREAFNLAEDNDMDPLIETYIYPAMIEYCERLKTRMEKIPETYIAHRNRLKVVREIAEKHIKEEALKREQREKRDRRGRKNSRTSDIDSDTSDKNSQISDAESKSTRWTTSSQSSMSRYSSYSSKKKRKEQRKMQDLKEGGVYEDIALMRAIHELFTKTIKLSEDVKSIIHTMLECTDTEEKYIRNLYENLMKVRTTLRQDIDEIWPECVQKGFYTDENAAITRNVIHLDDKYRIPPNWEPSEFELHAA